jgi:hypothetical protein
MKSRGYAALNEGSTLVPFEFNRRDLGLHDVCLEQYCLEGMTGTYNSLERDGTTVTMVG